MTGRVIGNYRVSDYIGGGGFGSVFKAEDINTPGRVVAIKELHKKHTRSSVIKQRFFQEAVAMARLDHPNLPRLFTFGEDNGSYYLVMEFLSGKLLSEVVAEQGALSTEQAASILCQVLEGVSYAHRNGIIHRDLKPDNIILLNENNSLRVKVLDFGIARMVGGENLTLAGEGFGTPAYMSPERMAGSAIVDHHTDIYSAGIILYEMLTGKAPFESKATDPAIYWSEMRGLHERGDLAPLSSSALPHALEAVIKKAIARRVEDRYATADEMLADLRAVSGGASDFLKEQTARLALTTVPGGAEVLVDNAYRGTSDEARGKILIDSLAPGLHSVRVLKPGFNEYAISVALEEGKQTDLQVALAARSTMMMPQVENTSAVDFSTRQVQGGENAKTAILMVESLPAGSTVFVGTQAMAMADEDGRATVQLIPGVHEIQVASPAGSTTKKVVTISEHDTGSLKTMALPFSSSSDTNPTVAIRKGETVSLAKNRMAMAAAVALLIALGAAAYFVLRGPSRGNAQSDNAQVEAITVQPVAPQSIVAPQPGSTPQPAEPGSQEADAQKKAEEAQAKAKAAADLVEREKKELEAKTAELKEAQARAEEGTPPTPPKPPEQVAASNACLYVRVLQSDGSPGERVRVAVVEQPGTGQERLFGGPVGPKGGWQNCGLTVGHKVLVEAIGPGRTVLGSKYTFIGPGRNLVEISITAPPQMGPREGGLRERPRRNRPFFKRP